MTKFCNHKSGLLDLDDLLEDTLVVNGIETGTTVSNITGITVGENEVELKEGTSVVSVWGVIYSEPLGTYSTTGNMGFVEVCRWLKGNISS